jgi:hypothetical protein
METNFYLSLAVMIKHSLIWVQHLHVGLEKNGLLLEHIHSVVSTVDEYK